MRPYQGLPRLSVPALKTAVRRLLVAQNRNAGRLLNGIKRNWKDYSRNIRENSTPMPSLRALGNFVGAVGLQGCGRGDLLTGR